MADTTSRNEGGLSGKSYKDKLLQPSDQDELSVPDLPETPTVPPTEDEGSPPMTVPVGEYCSTVFDGAVLVLPAVHTVHLLKPVCCCSHRRSRELWAMSPPRLSTGLLLVLGLASTSRPRVAAGTSSAAAAQDNISA